MVMVKLVAVLRVALELVLLTGRAGLGNRLCRAGGDFGPLLSLDLRLFVDWSRFYYIVIRFGVWFDGYRGQAETME